MVSPTQQALAAAAGLAALAAVWVGLVALSALFGWRHLSERFPAGRWPGPGEGTPMERATMWIGIAGYRRLLRAVLTDEGVFLRPYAPFAFNHRPLFLPWAAMGAPEHRTLTGLRVPLEGGRPVAFLGPLAQAVEAALAARGGVPAAGGPAGVRGAP